MDDNEKTPEQIAATERYQEKVEAKRERYAERAQNLRGEANRRFESARVVMEGIPMGQPILVGHHSERRHRRDIERIDTNLRKGTEASDKAAHYASKAESYGTHGISSDDPDAVAKLRAELAERKATREMEVAANKQLKRLAAKRTKELGRELTPADHIELIAVLVTTKTITESIGKALCSYAKAFRWLPQFGPNTGADVRRIEKRIAELESARAMPDREDLIGTVDGVNYRIEWNKADNRVQIYFPTRPSDQVVERLKSRGFRWARSVAAWQRQANEGAWYHARYCVGHKDPTTTEGGDV